MARATGKNMMRMLEEQAVQHLGLVRMLRQRASSAWRLAANRRDRSVGLTSLMAMLAVPLIFAVGITAAANEPDPDFDLLILGGEIVDGTGADRYRADIAVKDNTIVAIGRFPEATAVRIIDASGKIVTPGFIDLHTHLADLPSSTAGVLSPDPRRRAAQNYVAQGVTTAVINSDGMQPDSLAEQRQQLEELGFGPNLVPLNGHNTLRALNLTGSLERPANAEEIAAMAAALEQDLSAGLSFGVYLGTEYFSGRFSSAEEQLALAHVVARHNGIFIPHIRSQGIAPMWYRPSQDGDAPPTLTDAIKEVLSIAEQSGAKTVFTHMKAWGPGFRGQAQESIAIIEAARQRGARIYMDVYPYTSSGSDGDFKAIPLWAVADRDIEDYKELPTGYDFTAALDKTLRNPSLLADLKADVLHTLALKGGAENVVILDHANPAFIGKTYAALMDERGLDQLSLAIALQREGSASLFGGAKMRALSMAEQDLVAFYSLPWTATSTDGWVVLPEDLKGMHKYLDTNPRCFGSFPRRIDYFSQELGVDSLEHAVRSASGLPARILGLRDRGELIPGSRADIVVFDLDQLEDRTSIEEPNNYPAGIEHVFVNGVPVVLDGERTLALPGKVLRPVGRGGVSEAQRPETSRANIL